MLRATVLALAVAGVSLAGCLGDDLDVSPEGDLSPGLGFTLGEMSSDGGPLLFEGDRLVGPDASIANSHPPFMPQPPRPTCSQANCQVVPLVVREAGEQELAIAVEWEAQDERWALKNGPGYYLGDPEPRLDAVVKRDGEVVLDIYESSHYGGVGIIPDPEAGLYEVEVVASRGQTTYYLVAALQEPEHAASEAISGELLPDLVAIPPDHPTFRVPIGHELGTHKTALAGCGPDEIAEDLDRRCLRFAGIIGNQGVGDFLTVLEFDAAERAMAGGEANWEQVIRSVDGSERRVTIGAADYHEVHGHFHILDFVATQLYTYDLASGERGDPVGDGRKMGFCVIDGGVIDLYGPLAPAGYDGAGCCYLAGICQMDMLNHERFQMGMSPNWYDIYPWWRSDQYVEVSDLQDGVYELVTVINPDGLILEADPDNNEASTVLRIHEDQVEVLSMQTQARLGPHPDADWGYAAQQKDSAP